MSDATRALVDRLLAVWNTGVLDDVDALYAEDYVADYRPYAPLRRGRQAVRDMVARARAAFPDYHEEVEEVVAEGEKVVVRFTITGTQLGSWGPVPPTGKPVRFEEIAILVVRDGRVVSQRGIADNLAALRQLGVLPA